MNAGYTVVIPTTGRASLGALLAALDAAAGPAPEQVIVADNRAHPAPPLALPPTDLRVRVVHAPGRGPAAARNTGWRLATTEWVVFLDDDVLPGARWRQGLCEDLDVGADVGACQGRIVVPLPRDRAPTDLERATAGLASAWWITADMAYRREVLACTGGFDEDFPRAFREDADLALRAQARGYRLVIGRRETAHPVRPAGLLASVRAQAGNADNALMRRKYGPNWRMRIGEGPGRTRRHLLTTAAALAALAGAAARRPDVARAGAAVWLASTADFALRRILPGPRTPDEIARMVVTSVLIPPVACWHRARGELRVRMLRRAPKAVLFDRDDTLIHDVPYNGDPTRVRPVPGVREALDRLRVHGVRIGVVSNQSGVARGKLRPEQVDAVNAEVERLLGPIETWRTCPHGADEGCECRKPAPGLVLDAASDLRVRPGDCVVIGDTGADVAAARAAGAAAIMVPTQRTRTAEIREALGAAAIAGSVPEAVHRLLGGAR